MSRVSAFEKSEMSLACNGRMARRPAGELRRTYTAFSVEVTLPFSAAAVTPGNSIHTSEPRTLPHTTHNLHRLRPRNIPNLILAALHSRLEAACVEREATEPRERLDLLLFERRALALLALLALHLLGYSLGSTVCVFKSSATLSSRPSALSAALLCVLTPVLVGLPPASSRV